MLIAMMQTIDLNHRLPIRWYDSLKIVYGTLLL